VTVLLRAARLGDLPALLDVQQGGAVLALGHIFPQDQHPFPRAELQSRWAAEIADPAVDVLVIEPDGGRIAGFAAVRGNELLHFGTAVETWGSGLAAAAHDQLVARFSGDRAVLRVFEENRRARRFYEKLGWRCTGHTTRTSFPPFPVLIGYELSLTG
jgi:RimJ/RimL family protein N-acetyltransferase